MSLFNTVDPGDLADEDSNLVTPQGLPYIKPLHYTQIPSSTLHPQRIRLNGVLIDGVKEYTITERPGDFKTVSITFISPEVKISNSSAEIFTLGTSYRKLFIEQLVHELFYWL